MALTANLGYPLWLDGETFNGQLGRQIDSGAGFAGSGGSSAAQVMGGVVQGPSQMGVTPSSGMIITIAAGFSIIPNSSSALQGAYRLANMTSQNVTVATSDPTNPRIDLVVAAVVDNGDSTSYCYVGLVTGTPAGSPVAPTAPANSITLAQVTVGAGVTSIVSGNIADKRTYTAAPGGVIPWSSTGAAVGGVKGLLAYDVANDRFFHNGTTGAYQAKVLPWAPVVVQGTSSPGIQGSNVTLASTSITTNGTTDIEIEFDVPSWHHSGSNPGNPSIIAIAFSLDSTTLINFASPYLPASTMDRQGGGVYRYTTSSVAGDTPSNGSHTVSITCVQILSTGGYSVFNATPVYLRVKPAGL
jgi:hypothetical protein